jgi:hypothetical protein
MRLALNELEIDPPRGDRSDAPAGDREQGRHPAVAPPGRLARTRIAAPR